MKLTVKNIKKETKNAVTVCFKNGGFFNKIGYKPGQFMTLHVPIAGDIHKRAYSFSSSPYTDKDLEVTIKRVENGLVSNYIHDALNIGDKLEIDKPTGSFFVVPKRKEKKQYIFLAGGSGVTPVYSIIKSILEKESDSKILLIYANQDVESIIFKEQLSQLVQQHLGHLFIEYLISRECPELAQYHKGLITDDLVESLFNKHNISFKDQQFMICGPFGYMEAVKSILSVNGVSSQNIKVELFKSPSVVIDDKNLTSDVEIQLNGDAHQLKVSGNKSILQAAMANNIALPYSCRSGMCSTCKASCISGEIKMTEGHFLDQSEVDKGQILTCVSYPVSENVVIAF